MDSMLSQKEVKLERSRKHIPDEPKPRKKQQKNHLDLIDSTLSQKKVKPEESKSHHGTLTHGQATELTNQCLGKEFNKKIDQGEYSLPGDFSSKSDQESSKEPRSSLSLGLSRDQSLTPKFQSSKHSLSDQDDTASSGISTEPVTANTNNAMMTVFRSSQKTTMCHPFPTQIIIAAIAPQI